MKKDSRDSIPGSPCVVMKPDKDKTSSSVFIDTAGYKKPSAAPSRRKKPKIGKALRKQKKPAQPYAKNLNREFVCPFCSNKTRFTDAKSLADHVYFCRQEHAAGKSRRDGAGP